jgi:hypothetical protein
MPGARPWSVLRSVLRGVAAAPRRPTPVPSRRLRALGLALALLVPSGALVAQGGLPVGGRPPSSSPDTLARGRAIFAATCRSCHSVQPPGQGAPPMSVIARRYVRFSGSVVAAQSRIAEWLFRPEAEKSLLPREEREKYGLMPHQPLADAGRFAVAAYVVTLADSGRGR